MARDNPVYLAYCPECDQLVGASAILLDEPEVVREALRDKADWERQGWRVEVGPTTTFGADLGGISTRVAGDGDRASTASNRQHWEVPID